MGYNVQAAVDTKHHLIVAHEVSNVGTDRRHLTPMAKEAKAAIGAERLSVVADRGYYRAEELLDCEQADIMAYVPNSMTSTNRAKGLFDRSDFRYIAEDDEYECPAGKRLIYRFSRIEAGKKLRRYWSSACPACPIKAQCTTGVRRPHS